MHRSSLSLSGGNRPLLGQLAACGDDLGHGEILRVVDVQPLDAVHDGHPGPVADAAVAAAPQLPREDEEGAGLDVDRFDGLRARDVVERVVERPAPYQAKVWMRSALNAESYSPERIFCSASERVSARMKGEVACAST